MEIIKSIIQFVMDNPGILVPVVCGALVATLAQWSLYDKCGLPGIACIVPVWNVTTFMKIMGRPQSHSLMVMVPPIVALVSLLFLPGSVIGYSIAAGAMVFWIYIMCKMYIELVQCFGHYKLSDYLMVTLLNGFYVLHLGLSYKEKYRGPVYKKQAHSKVESQKTVEGQLA